MELHSYAFSSKGGREENQDSVAVREEKEHGVYALADGLGGLQNGREASELAVKLIEMAWKPKREGQAEDWLREHFEKANQLLGKYAEVKKAKVRTTLVALCVDGQTATWAHTGDSRLYFLHDGQIQRHTADHSVAYKKFKAGEISRTEIPRDDDQSALLKSLGGTERWEPDTDSCQVEAGDGFLLCSDGFWEFVHDDEILFDYLKASSAQDWAERLLVRVMARIEGDNDNLSVVTVLLA